MFNLVCSFVNIHVFQLSCVCVCKHRLKFQNEDLATQSLRSNQFLGQARDMGLRALIRGLCANSKKKNTRDKLITVMNTARALATGEIFLCGRLRAVVFAGNNSKIVDFKFQTEFDETATELSIYVSLE